ncbi:MAG: pyridoxamine 5'-phosphate oxidase family protein [Acidimicrobiia bacterium]
MATIPDSHADLLAGTVALTTLNPNGYPQVTAVVTSVGDDGKLHTSVNDVRQKYKNLVAHPKATVFAIDPANPYRTVEVRADVELIHDPGKAWSKSFIEGVDLDQIDPPEAERYHVVLTPTKVNTLSPGAF